MPEWSILPVVVLASFTLGWLVTGLFDRPKRRIHSTQRVLALVFAALTLGIAIIGWLALVLAEFGLFSIGRLAFIWLFLVIGLSILHWRLRMGRRVEEVDEVPPLPADSPLTIHHSPFNTFLFLPPWAEGIFLALWLAAAVWLFFRPHEYVLGGADAGVYVSLGASIAQTGGIVIQDETLAELDAPLYPAFLRPLPGNPVAASYLLPGFYVMGRPPGEITPQFYPLHPVWQAIAYSGAMGREIMLGSGQTAGHSAGVMAELLLPGLWALLAAFAVYLAVREFAGWQTAALALAGLTISALQVWFARYPTAEGFTQYLLWSGLWALAAWLGGRPPRPLWALLAGLALGEIFLLRIDMVVILPILALLVIWLLLRRQSATLWFLAPLLALILHSLLHALWQSRPYAFDLFGLSLLILRVNWWIPVAGLLAGALFFWAAWRSSPRLAAITARYRRFFLGALVLAAVLVAAYGWFVRPVLGEPLLRQDAYSQLVIPLTDHENWRRLGWYLSPLGIWLGVGGTCVLIWHVNRKTAVMLAVGATFAALYLWNLRANPHHIYAMRRYVPAVLPFFIVAAAVFLSWLAQIGSRHSPISNRQTPLYRLSLTAYGPLPTAYFTRGAAAILAVAWLTGLGWSARGFITQVDHHGLSGQLEALNQTLEANSILLFNDRATVGQGDMIGTPLRFIYGHDVFVFRDPAALDEVLFAQLAQRLQIWDNNGRATYWIGDPGWLIEQGLSFDSREFTVRSQRLESSYEHKPRAIEQQEWRLLLNKLRR